MDTAGLLKLCTPWRKNLIELSFQRYYGTRWQAYSQIRFVKLHRTSALQWVQTSSPKSSLEDVLVIFRYPHLSRCVDSTLAQGTTPHSSSNSSRLLILSRPDSQVYDLLRFIVPPSPQHGGVTSLHDHYTTLVNTGFKFFFVVCVGFRTPRFTGFCTFFVSITAFLFCGHVKNHIRISPKCTPDNSITYV